MTTPTTVHEALSLAIEGHDVIYVVARHDQINYTRGLFNSIEGFKYAKERVTFVTPHDRRLRLYDRAYEGTDASVVVDPRVWETM